MAETKDGPDTGPKFPNGTSETYPSRFVWQPGDIQKIDPSKVKIEIPAPRPVSRKALRKKPAKKRP